MLLCVPAFNAVVISVATPEARTVPVPSDVAPSMNVTFPVGIPAPGLLTMTVAESVTICP